MLAAHVAVVYDWRMDLGRCDRHRAYANPA